MRVTEKKLAANRQNAQKSTGPITDEGKQTVAQNAVRHGLYARSLILNSPVLKDDHTQYNALIYALDRDLLPEGLFEEFLVRKIANCLWRSRRVINAENAQIERQLDCVKDDIESHFRRLSYIDRNDGPPTPENLDRVKTICIGADSIPNETSSAHIMRYEMRLDRQLSRTLRMLVQLQNRRKSNKDKEKPREPLNISKQTQSSGNQLPDNRLTDAPFDSGV